MSDERKSGTKRHAMCLSVRGAIADESKSRAKISRLVSDDEGNSLTRLEGISWLMDQLAQGRETLPINDECKNPCTHADKGCKGFDYGKRGGCPGYFIDDEVQS